MGSYVFRRVLMMIPTVIGVSLLITALIRLLPGDAVDILVTENSVGGGSQAFKEIVNAELQKRGIDPANAGFGDAIKVENELIAAQLKKDGRDFATATDAQKQEARKDIAFGAYKDKIRREIGLDRSYFEQWFSWASKAVRGDFGTSLVGSRPVNAELRRRLPASIELGMLALLTSVVVALPIGVISAVKQDTFLDYGTRSFAIAMLALPSFFIATIVIALAAKLFKYSFPIFYKDPWVDLEQNLKLVLVPAIILGFSLSGQLMRLTRAQMLEVMRQDYIRTARAKGLRERATVIRHGVRNAFIPVVTVIGLQVPVLIGGSLVLEQIFGIPGVARYLFESIIRRDFPPIIAVNVVVCLAIVVANLVVDVMYAYLDPRIRYT